MVPQKRMSPLTALVLGIFAVLAVTVASASVVVVYGLRVAGTNSEALVKFAEHTVAGLPELLEALPPAVGDILNDSRAPTYVGDIDVDAEFVTSGDQEHYRPVLTVTNRGEEVVSMLAVRVAALSDAGVPIAEWTELAATPITLEDDDWRGPMMPGASRYIVVGGWRRAPADAAASIKPAVEISELRVWRGEVGARAPETVASAD